MIAVGCSAWVDWPGFTVPVIYHTHSPHLWLLLHGSFPFTHTVCPRPHLTPFGRSRLPLVTPTFPCPHHHHHHSLQFTVIYCLLLLQFLDITYTIRLLFRLVGWTVPCPGRTIAGRSTLPLPPPSLVCLRALPWILLLPYLPTCHRHSAKAACRQTERLCSLVFLLPCSCHYYCISPSFTCLPCLTFPFYLHVFLPTFLACSMPAFLCDHATCTWLCAVHNFHAASLPLEMRQTDDSHRLLPGIYSPHTTTTTCTHPCSLGEEAGDSDDDGWDGVGGIPPFGT